jgi:hypothetical protein
MAGGGHDVRLPHQEPPDAVAAGRGAAAEELEAGVSWVRELTGQRDVPFCYPWGGPGTYTGDTLDLLGRLGYSLAFCTVRRARQRATDGRFEVPRFDTRDLPAVYGAAKPMRWPHHCAMRRLGRRENPPRDVVAGVPAVLRRHRGATGRTGTRRPPGRECDSRRQAREAGRDRAHAQRVRGRVDSRPRRSLDRLCPRACAARWTSCATCTRGWRRPRCCARA